MFMCNSTPRMLEQVFMLNEKQRNDYLKRIGYLSRVNVDLNSLGELHQCHLENIPFENYDVTFKKTIELIPEQIYTKIVHNRRGGFCYELNSCFGSLLESLNFKVNVISAKVHDGEKFGPQFDHLCLVVDIENQLYLVDVGFGDSFNKPVAISSKSHTENKNKYKILKNDEGYTLIKSKEGESWKPQYKFTLKEYDLQAFDEMCKFHQTSYFSPFTRKAVCTHITKEGTRRTLSNNRMIETKDDIKPEKLIHSIDTYFNILTTEFGVNLKKSADAKEWFEQLNRQTQNK